MFWEQTVSGGNWVGVNCLRSELSEANNEGVNQRE